MTGCQWALLPKDFPPFTTVQHYFYRLRDSGMLDIINETLVMAARLLAGRAAEPTAGAIDSQSAKPPKAAAHAALMPARRSRAASAIFSPIPEAPNQTDFYVA